MAPPDDDIYYVDLSSPGAWNGRTGADRTGNEWRGLSGLQKALDTAAARDLVYVKAHATASDLTSLLTVSHDAWSGTALTQGEACSWDSGGTGVVSEVPGGASGTVVVELLSGAAPADNETITGTTSGETVTVSAAGSSVKAISLDVDGATGGGTTGYIRFIGVNSSWDNDGTRCVLAGDDSDPQTAGMVFTDNYYVFENFEIKDVDGDGFAVVGGVFPDGIVFINCRSHSNSGDGWGSGAGVTAIDGPILINCHGYSNGGAGYNFVYCGTNVPFFLGCSFFSNTGDGLYMKDIGAVVGCLFYENGGHGVETYSAEPPVLCQCVMDGQSGAGDCGIFSDYGFWFAIACRITGNAIGIKSDYYGIIHECYLPGAGQDGVNTANWSGNEPYRCGIDDGDAEGSNEEGGTDSDAGYTNSAGDDYNLATTATKRRTAITFPT